jgi:hypothetical protein
VQAEDGIMLDSPAEAEMKLDALEKQLSGSLLTPESPEYDARRRIWNAMIDRRPLAIACCSGPADVQAAVRFAVWPSPPSIGTFVRTHSACNQDFDIGGPQSLSPIDVVAVFEKASG